MSVVGFFRLLCFVLALLLADDLTLGAEADRTTQVNVAIEIPFVAAESHADPFNNVRLDVVFTDPNRNELTVPAFWDGGVNWKVRYASPVVGVHHYRTVCSAASDKGLHSVSGEIVVKPYTGDNRLYRHGPVRVASDRRHLQYGDGTPFFWLADTWWMGLCHRIHWPDEVKTLAADRKQKGFNVVQIVAGLYPDMPPFDPRGANEAGFPWEKEYARIRPEYFDAADQRLEYLVDQGITPCIVGAWGYFMPWMGVAKMEQHWRYLIARYGAMPVVWCAAGEANLPWYLVKGFPYEDHKQVADWTEVMRFIRKTDPFHRPLTIHPTGIARLSARNATNDPALLDIDMLQTPHAQREAVEPTVRNVQQSYADHPIMPVIDGEAAYEMLGDALPTKWTRQMFWLCMTNGAAGHTYGANGIWQCNRRGQPHGASPHGGNYGTIPWDEAMRLPGSAQVGLGKRLFEQFDWQKFAPHPEWVAYADAAGPEWGDWVWYPEGDPATDAPAERRYFRKTFALPQNAMSAHGTLCISADDRFTAYINGEQVGAHAGSGTFATYDVSAKLKPGRNVVAIVAENLPAPVPANPAGLIATLRIRTSKGEGRTIFSDKTWRAARNLKEEQTWIRADFDDRDWQPAKIVGQYGCQPWGRFASAKSYGPYAIGERDIARIIYVPESRAVYLKDFDRDSKDRLHSFDPTTGEMRELHRNQHANTGEILIHKPASIHSDDWVIVAEH